jgi:L,D-transpeptidase YcbB
MLRTALLLAGVLLLPAGTAVARQQAVGDAIRLLAGQLREHGRLTVADREITSADLVAQIYEQRGFEPLWTGPGRSAALLRVLRSAEADGLDPAFYHVAALASMGETPGIAETAALDVLRTDALVQLAHDLRFGRVDPGRLDASWNVARPAADPSADEIIALATSPDLDAAVQRLRPANPLYASLRTALASYRAMAAGTPWPVLKAGGPMRRDSADERVPVLRARLTAEGDLAVHRGIDRDSGAAAPDVFDDALDAAVRRFQHRHGLNEDGVVGPLTIAELNVPAATRVDQIRLNLERARWVLHDLEPDFVAVNIAGQRVYVVVGGEVVWESRTVVGAPYTRTPVFSAPMRYIDLNPTWTVPPGITGEILAAIRRDPGYLARQNIRVIDRSGRTVDRSSIDFSRYSGRTFPWVFRQDPGPGNALGLIKFLFPNPYNVYLHDTPARSLFERDTRTFSHGCIRVEDPLRLAEILLDDPVRWNRAALVDSIATGRTRSVHLASPVPVLILYWTASADLHDEVHFYRDVYGRDAALLRALDRPRPAR